MKFKFLEENNEENKIDKIPKNTGNNKQRAKSANIRKNLKSAQQKNVPSQTIKNKTIKDSEEDKKEEKIDKVRENSKPKNNSNGQKKKTAININNKSIKDNTSKKPNI